MKRSLFKMAQRAALAFAALIAAAALFSACSDSGGSGGGSADGSYPYGSVTLYPINSDNYDDDFMKGFDASTVSHLESCGAAFYEKSGVKTDIFKILANHGFNWARLRIWHNPASSLPGNNTYDRTLAMAKRAKAAGLKLLLDFHYSDTWADPSKQYYPASWDSISAIGGSSDTEAIGTSLCGTIYAYTYEVVKGLSDAGCAPDMVQIGNEINGGMLTSTSSGGTPSVSCSTSNSSNLTNVLTSAANAVKAVDDDINVMIHLASSSFSSSWFSSYASGVEYDYIGLSWYPLYSSHGTLKTLRSRIKNLISTYNKEVLVVETSWGWDFDAWSDNTSNEFWYDDGVTAASLLVDDDNTVLPFLKTQTYSGSTCVSASYQNQATIVRAIAETVAEAGGCGVFYWGGDWIPDGNNQIADNWENQTLFDFDGVALPSIDMFAASNTTTSSGSTDSGISWISVTSGTYSGYYSGDVSSFSLSSSTPSALIKSSVISGASEVVLVFTTSSTSAWLSLCTDSSWSNEVESGVWQDSNNTSTSYTYTLTLNSSGITKDSTSLSFKSVDGTPTLNTYSSGLYVAGQYCTVAAVYYK